MSTNNLEEKVMLDIKSGRVKLRSKYIFLAEKLGIGSALVLTILLAILFFSLALFYLKASDNLWYLSFGSRGLLAFLESFPYLLVVTFIVLFLLAGFIIKKSGVWYQRPFGYLALALIGFIIITGFTLASTRMMEGIEGRAFAGNRPGMVFRPFLGRIMGDRNWGLAGRVVEKGSDFINIQTPQRIIKIDLKQLKVSLPPDIAVGDFIMAVGERNGGQFGPQELRLISPDEMPMVRRGVHRRFGEQKDFFNKR